MTPSTAALERLRVDTDLLGRFVGGPVGVRDAPILTLPSAIENEQRVTLSVPLSNGVPTVTWVTRAEHTGLRYAVPRRRRLLVR